MKILIACSNSLTHPIPGVKLETDLVKNALETNRYQVVLNDKATLTNIAANFQQNPNNIAIFHYSGHANGKAIELWQDLEGGKNKNAYAEGFAQYIGTQNTVRFVFLNGCSSQGQVDYFLKNGVRAVIATNRPVNDTIAQQFAEHFYKTWISGKTLKFAFESALALVLSGYASFSQLNRAMLLDDEDEADEASLNQPTYQIFPPLSEDSPVHYATLRELLNGFNPPIKKKKLFVCYAEEDADFTNNLKKQMAALERRGMIEWRSANTTELGNGIDAQMEDFIQTSDIVLLMVSPDFLASEDIWISQIEPIMLRFNASQCAVIPILLRNCPFRDTVFGGLQFLPRNGKPVKTWTDQDEALLAVQTEVKKVVELNN